MLDVVDALVPLSVGVEEEGGALPLSLTIFDEISSFRRFSEKTASLSLR